MTPRYLSVSRYTLKHNPFHMEGYIGEKVGSLFLGRSNDLHLLGFGDSLWDDNQIQCHFEIIKAGDQVVEQKVIGKEDNTATRYLDP